MASNGSQPMSQPRSFVLLSTQISPLKYKVSFLQLHPTLGLFQVPFSSGALLVSKYASSFILKLYSLLPPPESLDW